MNYLSVDNLSKHYGERVLFENISFGLAKGDKVALIANNGTGKSSLLKILAGQDIADGGSFSFRDGVRVTYLEQEPVFAANASQTIEEFVQQANAEVLEIIRRYESALEKASDGNAAAMKEFERASSAMDSREAWDFDRRLKAMLGRFGIEDLSQKVGDLSGGQKKRLAIALVILDQPDFLMLDEPTNHLDIVMVEWLEEFFIQTGITLLMVTHDRYFLDRVCNNIIEMTDGKLYRHLGGYETFLETKAQREEVYQTEIDKANKLMRKELEWMRRQPKARTTKSKSRIDSFYEIQAKANSGKKREELKLDVKMSRIGGKILELKKVYKAYDDLQILKGFDYTFKSGERIGIIGQNGVGKTTFLNIITGKEAPDSGKINVGETIVYGYYNQQGIELKADKRVIDVLKDIAEVIQLKDGTKVTAGQFLQQFLFTPEMQFTFVSKLSGGERRRLQLLMVLIKNPNFLILDEPTNDLDLITLQKLEEFLDNFAGCLVIVSHDRYFMDRLVDHLFIFEGNASIRDFWGPYSEWKAEQDAEIYRPKVAEPLKIEAKQVEPIASAPTPEKKKMSFNEKFELEQLDKEIPALEAEKAALEAKLHSADLPYNEIEKTSLRLGELSAILDEKLLRWMELDELKT